MTSTPYLMEWRSAHFLPDSPWICRVGTLQSRWVQDPGHTEKGQVEMKKGAEGGSRALGHVWGPHGKGAAAPMSASQLEQGPSTPEPSKPFSLRAALGHSGPLRRRFL